MAEHEIDCELPHGGSCSREDYLALRQMIGEALVLIREAGIGFREQPPRDLLAGPLGMSEMLDAEVPHRDVEHTLESIGVQAEAVEVGEGDWVVKAGSEVRIVPVTSAGSVIMSLRHEDFSGVLVRKGGHYRMTRNLRFASASAAGNFVTGAKYPIALAGFPWLAARDWRVRRLQSFHHSLFHPSQAAPQCGSGKEQAMAENLVDPDIDFLSLENPSQDKKRKGPPRSDDALANAVVANLITSEIADKLEGDIAVSLIIDVPDHDWLIALHRAVKLRFPKLRGKSYIESRTARTSQESSHIAFLHGGDPILSVSTSIDHLVPASILQSADIVLRVEEIDRNSVARRHPQGHRQTYPQT